MHDTKYNTVKGGLTDSHRWCRCNLNMLTMPLPTADICIVITNCHTLREIVMVTSVCTVLHCCALDLLLERLHDDGLPVLEE